MEKNQMIERAKLYMKLLGEGVHPVTGQEIPTDSALMDEKVKRCFAFINEILDEYMDLAEKVEQLEADREKKKVVVAEKQAFAITEAECENVKLSKEPITLLSFAKNINAAVDTAAMEKLSSTRLSKWLADRGFVTASKVRTVVNKTVYKPSEAAMRLGIVEEEVVDKKSGEVKTQIKLEESAQLFILENIEEIIATTK